MATWAIGIKTAHGKFFTVETFGDQLNASGGSLRTKQVWTLELQGNKCFFKGPNGKYLSSDHKGDVNAKATSKGAIETFELAFTNGVYTIKNENGKFLSADAAGKVSVAATASANEQFELQINQHPQVCITNAKHYLATEGEKLSSNRATQFGEGTCFTIEESGTRGQYFLQASNGKFVSVEADGTVASNKPASDASCLVAFEFYDINIAIKSIATGAYFSVVAAGIKAKSSTVGAKETFLFTPSILQITLKANNNKYVSFQGTNILCNRDSISNEEIFLLEMDKEGKVSFRTVSEVYWSAKEDGGVIVDAKTKTAKELFTVEYSKDGKTSIKAASGKYLSAKPLGGVDAKAVEVTPKEQFTMQILNRPLLVLQTSSASFVGTAEGKVKTNKATPEVLLASYADGKYVIKASSGKYVIIGAENRGSLGDVAQHYFFEVHNSKLAIRDDKGRYLKAEHQGWLVPAPDEKPDATCLYDF